MDVGKYCNSDTHYTYKSLRQFQKKIDYSRSKSSQNNLFEPLCFGKLYAVFALIALSRILYWYQ